MMALKDQPKRKRVEVAPPGIIIKSGEDRAGRRRFYASLEK